MRNKVFIIVEVAQAHDGSLGILHSYIDAVSKIGVDAIKFQTHIAEAESSKYEIFRVNFSYEDKTRYEYWKRMEFTLEQWKDIKKHCETVGLEFMSSPFSCAAVDLLESVGIKRYKIGSGEVTNFLMLEKIARTGKPIILSTGMSSFKELDKTIEFLKPFKNKLAILQCSTSYPTKPESVGLNVINELKRRYNIPVGLSDHSGTIYPAIAAVSLGVNIIEVHVVFDKIMFGPDSTSSLTIEELKQMVDGIRFIEKSLNNPVNKDDNSKFLDIKKVFEKSLAYNRDFKKGHTIKFEDLESKKPYGQGIPAKDYRLIIGKKLKKEVRKYSFLKEENIE